MKLVPCESSRTAHFKIDCQFETQTSFFETTKSQFETVPYWPSNLDALLFKETRVTKWPGKIFLWSHFERGYGNSPIIRNFMFSFRKEVSKGQCQPLLGRSFIFIRSDKVIFSIEYRNHPHLPFTHIFSWSVPNIKINFFLTKNDILTKICHCNIIFNHCPSCWPITCRCLTPILTSYSSANLLYTQILIIF